MCELVRSIVYRWVMCNRLQVERRANRVDYENNLKSTVNGRGSGFERRVCV
jgi:hypothetical protein